MRSFPRHVECLPYSAAIRLPPGSCLRIHSTRERAEGTSRRGTPPFKTGYVLPQKEQRTLLVEDMARLLREKVEGWQPNVKAEVK